MIYRFLSKAKLKVMFNENHNIITGTVYRPNSGSNKDSDNPDAATQKQRDLYLNMHIMHELHQLLMAENKETYITGYMNIDLLQIDNHKKLKTS